MYARMPSREQKWLLGNVEFCLILGDLFEVPVDSIVNSENSRFRMAPPGHRSVSGQLAERFPEVRRDLAKRADEWWAEDGEEPLPREGLPLGTVLETPGYSEYQCIYHLGHHPPAMWHAGELSGDEQAQHFRVIRGGVADVLQRFADTDMESVAFPLIGCGSFRLDPWLLAYEFIDEVMAHANQPAMHDKQIWLVVLDEEDFDEALNAIIQALSDRHQVGVPWPAIDLGVDYLDQFEKRSRSSKHPLWAKWTLTRYAELMTGYLFYELCRVISDPLTPTHIAQEERSSFGFIHTHLMRLAQNVTSSASFNEPDWALSVSEAVNRDRSGQRIQRIIEDRNHIAHGRQARPFSNIRDDLLSFVDDATLHDHVAEMIPESDLAPWTHLFTGEVGVLDRWTPKKRTYIIPHLRRSHAVAGA